MENTKKLIKDTVKEVLAQHHRDKTWNAYKATEARLRAYPVLKDNVENVYPADIADLQRERVSGKSKDIVMWSTSGGLPISPEERQEAKILAVKMKLARDRESLRELDRALVSINTDVWYSAFADYYFVNVPLDQLAENMHESIPAVQRNKARLVKILAVRLYGADALE